MRRMCVGIGFMTVFMVLVAPSWGAAMPTLAQDDEADDLAATVEALDDRVSALETQVAELTATEDEDDDAAATGARPTPTAAQTAGQDREDENDDEDAAGEASDAASGPTGTRDNPIPLGDSATSGDYTITVIDVVPDAADLVLAANQFNEPPAAGTQFSLVGVEVTYSGTTTGQPSFDLNFQAVGERAVVYSPFDASCGVVPADQFQANELFPGGTTQFNVCWAIDSADAESLVMFVEPLFAFDVQPVFFALRDA